MERMKIHIFSGMLLLTYKELLEGNIVPSKC